MRRYRWSRAAFSLALMLVAGSIGTSQEVRAQALVTQGIGTASCAKLGADLRPAEGLSHLPNALLFYWIQGYLSAANIYLLNEYTSHIDMTQVESDRMIQLVAGSAGQTPTRSRSARSTSSFATPRRSTSRNPKYSTLGSTDG